MKSTKLWERIHFILIFIILILVVVTPYIVNSKFLFIEEEYLEMGLIVMLFIIGYAIFRLYRKEVERNLEEIKKINVEKNNLEDRITESFKYIGSLNVQIEEIRSIFSDIKKFPENKKDFKYILQYSANKLLSIVNADWVLVRIIDTQNFKNLREYSKARGQTVLPKCNIKNGELLAGKCYDGYSAIKSAQENFRVITACIFPVEKINENEEILIKAIINQLEMLFVIFSSNYYKNSRIK
ncbi:MAG: hypothetical protein ABH830_01765 [Patescibacteria group bacterium]